MTERGPRRLRPRLAAATAAALLAWAAAGAAPGGAAGARFVVAPESRIEYVSATQLGEFRGAGPLMGEILFDPAAPAQTQLTVSTDPRTLRSDNGARDQHMQDKLLEVARFPAVTLTAREFRPAATASGTQGDGVLLGTLALHGVERPVTVPMRYVLNGAGLQATAQFTVNLTDFQMTPPRLLGLKVRNEVVIEARVVARPR
jgi:polyisoprenoid-binding protein YceI